MARGIEGQDIFRDTRDLSEFLHRLSQLVTEGKVQLFAWCLMPNHFHFLVRPRVMLLSTMMRRLMTGYAVWHNRRHNRKGHLFQNRYKSIVVEEDPYFLELVRYIHLNPVRARLVNKISELGTYPYTGHSVIMGQQDFDCQDVEGVLMWFGDKAEKARREYRSFVAARFDQGTREDLRSGGFIRSARGTDKFSDGKDGEEDAQSDSRILGSGRFVEQILLVDNQHQIKKQKSSEDILSEVCTQWGISREQILSKTKVRRVTRARREFLLRAQEEAGESMASLARLCGLAHTSVREAIEKARTERMDY
jgi:REP element-mobilizing transposase RayT